jgi:hypothetical protein
MVGSLDLTPHSEFLDRKANYSNGGPGITIYSAGTGIVSSMSNRNGYGKNSQYKQTSYKRANLTGTSMATPNVTGMVSLLLQNEPGMTPAEVIEKLDLIGTETIYINQNSPTGNDYTNLNSSWGGSVKVAYVNTLTGSYSLPSSLRWPKYNLSSRPFAESQIGYPRIGRRKYNYANGIYIISSSVSNDTNLYLAFDGKNLRKNKFWDLAKTFPTSPGLRGTSEIEKKVLEKLDRKFNEAVKPAIKEVKLSITRDVLKFDQSTKLAYKPVIKEITKTVPKIPPVVPIVPVTPTTPTPTSFGFRLSKPKQTKRTKTKKIGGVIPYGRRKGKYIALGGPTTLEKAKFKAKKFLLTTLGASAQVRTLKGEKLKIAEENELFRPGSKGRDLFTLVQRRSKRLKSRLETSEIVGVRRGVFFK